MTDFNVSFLLDEAPHVYGIGIHSGKLNYTQAHGITVEDFAREESPAVVADPVEA